MFEEVFTTEKVSDGLPREKLWDGLPVSQKQRKHRVHIAFEMTCNHFKRGPLYDRLFPVSLIDP